MRGPDSKHFHTSTLPHGHANLSFQGSNMAKEEARLQPFYSTQTSDVPGNCLRANNFVWDVLAILHPLQSVFFFFLIALRQI